MRLSLLLPMTAAVATSLRADEPLVQPLLNAVLPKISSGMGREDISKILAAPYPKVEAFPGTWSGQTGYMDFKLDERFRISISASFDARQREIVHDEILIYVFDEKKKERVEIKRFSWADRSKEASPSIKE